MLDVRRAQESAQEILRLFEVDENLVEKLRVIKAEDVTPDSIAMVLVNYSDAERPTYVLYGEDSAYSLKYAEKEIRQWYPCEIAEAIKSKQPIEYDENAWNINPNREEVKEWTSHATSDGHFVVFLFKVKRMSVN